MASVAKEKPTQIGIVGGGLVGALAACYLAKRGHRVTVYEYRADIRVEESRGQSIDLALSNRGREALRGVGLEDALLKRHAVPMRGRMLHGRGGELKEILYDSVTGNCIYSVGRQYLNGVLLDAAEKYPEVELKFNKKLIDADLEEGRLKFFDMKTENMENVKVDLIIGADGAYSTIRKIMSKRPLFNCSQTYIEHGYVELFLPFENDENFTMSSNHLHIWPRGEFMMIALPNDDRTFTCNLFAPFTTLNKLKTPESMLNFYNYHFPDLVRLIGEEKLVTNFFSREAKTLISIKCKPYHVGKTALIIGDAAHAMVPFYAQGMNTGFEDCLLLDQLMQRYKSDFSKILPMFSEQRCDDAQAICDLAMYNYVEMRDLVTTKSFMIRKCLDMFLYRLVPNTWIPLYSSIHFSRMEFRKCIANREWQDKVIRRSLWCLASVILGIFIMLTSYYSA